MDSRVLSLGGDARDLVLRKIPQCGGLSIIPTPLQPFETQIWFITTDYIDVALSNHRQAVVNVHDHRVGFYSGWYRLIPRVDAVSWSREPRSLNDLLSR